MKNKGIWLAILATLISGFAVFINKYALAGWGSSEVYTSAKNIVAAVLLSSIFIGFGYREKLKQISLRQWGQLLLIGLIGGSIPFLMFFKGLQLSSAPGAAFWHKTLFIWVAILAYPILKEKLSKLQLAAFGVLILGNVALFWPKVMIFNSATLLILGATVLWALENVLAKIFMKEISPAIMAWGRMSFGAIILILYLVATSKGAMLFDISISQLPWLLIVGVTLFLYVSTWYRAINKIPVTIATAILTAASPITTLLNNLVKGTALPNNFWLYMIPFFIGIVALILFRPKKKLDHTATIC